MNETGSGERFNAESWLFRKSVDEENLALAIIWGERLMDTYKSITGVSLNTEFCADAFRLARVYEKLEMYDKALPLYKKVIKNSRSIEISRIDFLEIKNNFGVCLARNGRAKEAVAILRNVCKERSKLQGNKHEDVFSTHYNIANAYFDDGDYGRALKHLKKALPGQTGNPGVNADILNSMGYCFERLEKFNAAAKCFETAVSLLRSSGTEDEAANLIYLADLYAERGKNKRAVRCYREGLAVSRELYGENHPQHAKLLNNISDCLIKEGRIKKAVKYRVRSIVLMREAFGENHMHYAEGLRSAAFMYYELKETERAVRLLTRAVKVYRGLTGIVTNEFISDSLTLVKWLSEIGDFHAVLRICGGLMKLTEAEAEEYTGLRKKLRAVYICVWKRVKDKPALDEGVAAAVAELVNPKPS
jgi:tetratricopeptide (TPR) repeat protein